MYSEPIFCNTNNDSVKFVKNKSFLFRTVTPVIICLVLKPYLKLYDYRSKFKRYLKY